MKFILGLILLMSALSNSALAKVEVCEENSLQGKISNSCFQKIENKIRKIASPKISEDFGIEINIEKCVTNKKKVILDFSTSAFIVGEGYLPGSGAQGQIQLNGNDCIILSIDVDSGESF